MEATGRPEETLLKQAITALHTQPGWQLSDTDLNARLTTLATAWHHLGTLIGRLGLEADARDSMNPLGYTSAAMLIANTAPLSINQAHQLTKRGKRIETLDDLDEAYRPVTDAHNRGEIPSPNADLIAGFLARFNNLLPDTAKEAVVATLLGFAGYPDTRQLRDALTTFRESLERDQDKLDPGEDRDLDSLHLSPLLNGRYKLDADLNKVCAEMLVTLLDALGAPQTAGEHSTLQRRPEQLRHDGFEELLRRCLASVKLPEDGGARPNVTVMADFETLFGDVEQPWLFDIDIDHDTTGTSAAGTDTGTDASVDDADDDTAGDVENEADPDQLGLFDIDIHGHIHDNTDESGGSETAAAAGDGCCRDAHDHDAHDNTDGNSEGEGHSHNSGEGEAAAAVGDRCCDDHDAHDHDHEGEAGGRLLWRRRRHNKFTEAFDRELAAVVARMRARLERRIAGAAKLSWTGTITTRYARMIACDANLRPILRDNDLPIDMGRSNRTVTPALRRYLVLRDGGCAFPGCRRPPSWCDAHHVIWWSKGGTTDRHNLVLLCRHHHTLIHQGAWDIRMDEFEVPWFIPSMAVDHFRIPIPANGRTPRQPYPTAA